MADELNYKINVEVDPKKAMDALDKLGKKIGMTGEQLKELTDVRFESASLEVLAETIGRIQKIAERAGKDISKSLTSELGATLRAELAKVETLADNAVNNISKKRLSGGTASPGTSLTKTNNTGISISKSPESISLQEAIRRQLFKQLTAQGVQIIENAFTFDVASFATDQSSIKQKVSDLDSDVVETVDLLIESIQNPLRDLNIMARELANLEGIDFKNTADAFAKFSSLTSESDAEELVVALENISKFISTNNQAFVIDGGLKKLNENLINDFQLNQNGTNVTINPAMLINAAAKAFEEEGPRIVSRGFRPESFVKLEAALKTVQSEIDAKVSEIDSVIEAPVLYMETLYQELDNLRKKEAGLQSKLAATIGKELNSTSYFEGLVDQAPKSIQDYLLYELSILDKYKRAGQATGEEKFADKIRTIEENIFQRIFDDAMRAGEGALRDTAFDRRQLDIYAPAADVEAIAGSQDTENLMRYAEEAAAKSVHEAEVALGLELGTFAKFAGTTFSKRFNEFFGEILSEPGALFDPAKVLGAAKFTTFGLGETGITMGSGLGSKPLEGVKSIRDQILENPAILENLIGVKKSSFDKKVEENLKRIAGAGGSTDAEGVKQAVLIAWVQSFIGQIKNTKPLSVKELDAAVQAKLKEDATAEIAAPRVQVTALDAARQAARKRGAEEATQPREPRTREERAADKAYGQQMAVRIAKERDLQLITQASIEADRAYGRKLAKRIALYKEAGQQLSDAEIKDIVARRNAIVEETKFRTDNTAQFAAWLRSQGKTGTKPAIVTPVAPAQPAQPAQPAIPVSMQAPAGQKPVAQISILEDWLTRKRRELEKAQQQHGPGFAVAFDTEFNNQVKQFLTECSIVFKDASGQFRSLLDFINIPSDAERLANGRAGEAQNAKDLIDRAEKLGIPREKIGGTGNKKLDQELTYKQAQALVATIEMVQGLGIPFTGSNLPAEQNAIKNFIKYVNTFAKSIGQEQLSTPDIMALENVFDSFREFKKLPRTNDIVSKLPLTDKRKEPSTGLQNVFAEIARQFPELLSEFSGFVRMTKNGPLVKTLAGGKEVPAHFAQADAIMSLIVNELWQRIMPPSIAARAVPTPKPGSTGGGGKPPTNPPTMPPADGGDDPMASRRANNLARLFHTTSEYVRMVNGLTGAELKIARDKLSIVRKNSEQVTLDANLTTVEKQLAEKRIENARIRKTATKQELVAAQPGFIGPAPSANGALIQEYTQLQEAQLKATRKGRKEEQEIIDGIFEQRKAKEGLLLNTRRQLDAEIELNQAGKQFTAQVKANIKAEIDAQKQLQRVNKEQINQWVTARYALYDVGNFYTNIYQQMFRLTRQIFASTQAYRSYETAFTSVERAMQLTAEGAIDVKNQFILLSQETPIAFEELSKIATLGAQMGINASGIQAFTENIAQFASVTGISADTVAQKFGRIAELAKVDSSDFNKLGSAVAYAGVNAVATESEILNLSEAIAAVSTNVGFTPQEVVGLSTALASVGVQAEQARGVFTRVFADIDRAVSKGGPALDAFAKASGMSSEAFAQAWGKDGKAGAVFRQFLGGLGASSDITKTFDSLNIVESREINTLTRLAKSLGVVDQAMSDANISYAEGTFLSDSFNKTVDNLDSQITIFKNNLNSLSAAFGEGFGKPLKDIIAFGSKVLEFAKGGASSGWASGLGLASMLITGIGGAAALATSGVTKLIAQIYALRVAQIQSLNASATDVIGPVNRIKQLTGAYAGLIEMRSELQGIAGPEVKGVVTPVTYGVKDQIINQKNALMEFVKTRDFAAARAILTNGKENELLAKSNIYLVTANSHRAEAVLAARAEADAVQRVIQAEKSRNAAIAERDGLNAAQVAELNNKKFFIEVVNGQKAAVSAETVAELQNTIASKASTVAQREQAAARLANIDATRALTAETEVASTATMRFGSRLLGIFGKIGAWGAAAAGIISIVGMLSEAITKANDIKFLEGGGGVESLRSAIEQDTKAWKENGEAISTVSVQYDDLSGKTNQVATSSATIKNVNGELVTVLDKTTDKVKSQTVAIGNNTKEWMLNAIVGNEKVNEWLKSNPTLFNDAESALKGYGTSFSDVMKTMLSDPKNGQENALNKVNGALEKNKQALIARARELVKLNPSGTYGDMLKDPAYQALLRRENAIKKLLQLIPQMSGALGQALNTSGFVNSMKAALGITEDLGDAITNTTSKVKTLTQWAGEVGQVMQSAFDIRYGKITALDNVRKAWFDLKKRVDDAKKAIKKAQDQMAALKATKGVLEYQLGIALKYGDSKRAAEIQAKLAENATSISEAADQEAEAQKNASMELRDGSEAAIQNRAALGGLVQTYIPYIQALLNSGKSQKEVAIEVDKLKKQFAAQAKEIGFADADLTGYLGTFDTYKTVVEKMPKDVTVNIKGLDAATRAMKEFADSLKNVYSQTPATGSIVRRAIAAQITQKEISLQMYKGLFAEARTTAEKLRYVNIVDRLGLDLKALQNSYAQFATGGYVSGPGTGTSDSVNAKLSNGEFVMSAKSVSTYGVDFMNALNQSKVLYNTTPMQQSQAQSGTSLVYLSPDDRALLRAAIDRPVNLYADSTRLAQSVNNGNKILAQRGTI